MLPHVWADADVTAAVCPAAAAAAAPAPSPAVVLRTSLKDLQKQKRTGASYMIPLVGCPIAITKTTKKLYPD
jgi:hypothetical protein